MTGQAPSAPSPEDKAALILELMQQGIRDDRVLAAVERVPRELFVPETFRPQAWANTALPIAAGQTISQPFVVAFMTMALQIGPRQKVLEIGTGSGYQAAVLALLARRVCTVERHRNLRIEAEGKFQSLGLTNIVTRLGDGMKGWPELAPFERIMVTAAAETMPETLIAQLSPDGGVMVLPLGAQHYDQDLVRVTRNGDSYTTESLLPVRFVPLLPGLGLPA